MKTIRGMKIYILMIALLSVTTSCVQSTSSSKSKNSSTAIAENNADSADDSEYYYDETPGDDGDAYYDDEDEDEDNLPGIPYSSCGVIYKQLNNENTFFRDSDGDTLIVQNYSYESAAILNQVQSISDTYSDAYNTCLEGYIESGVIYLEEAQLNSEAANPSRAHQGNYSYEYCGYMAHTTYSSNNFTLIRVGGYDRRVKNQTGTGFPSTIPSVNEMINSENAIEACVYANKALYKDTSTTFYRTIDTLRIDLGALN
ncbi:MAG: hypothetical protein CME63_17640 [Halobacteriovoraceae bacterium]|nr:hypothetical protein [Halobacteriovoraceae bacterium]MBC99572.1 hypothetical protein [Halobacteriovoraceae bacterium]|tara:strand:+ start:46691 stop:47461 length:771 start_codon:yes stop_codon:yes gene_type:complete